MFVVVFQIREFSNIQRSLAHNPPKIFQPDSFRFRYLQDFKS